jgi:hypothetical protein
MQPVDTWVPMAAKEQVNRKSLRPESLHWSQPGQGKRRRRLKGSFGSTDNRGERPVLTFTTDSYGHKAHARQFKMKDRYRRYSGH